MLSSFGLVFILYLTQHFVFGLLDHSSDAKLIVSLDANFLYEGCRVGKGFKPRQKLMSVTDREFKFVFHPQKVSKSS